ncbi:hypothetical protein AB0L44_15145 [Nonomuraea wenchangensis]|uniref:hypothetical protein n=1 Tax=Nonomuraea wenchangensis TaxID=568860 RepID=UPI00341A5CAD
MSARATPGLLTTTRRDKTRHTDLHGLIFDLLVNPKLVSIQRAGGRVLLSDHYSLWNLTTLRLTADGDRISARLPAGSAGRRLTQPSHTPRPDHNAGSAA